MANRYDTNSGINLRPHEKHLQIKYKFRAFCSDTVVVGCDGKLAAEIADGIIIEGDSQFQFDGHPSFAVAQIPNTFSPNGIYHRSDFILCTPYGIEVSHNTQYSVPR